MSLFNEELASSVFLLTLPVNFLFFFISLPFVLGSSIDGTKKKIFSQLKLAVDHNGFLLACHVWDWGTMPVLRGAEGGELQYVLCFCF